MLSKAAGLPPRRAISYSSSAATSSSVTPGLIDLSVSYELTEPGVIRYQLGLSPKGQTAIVVALFAVTFKMASMRLAGLGGDIILAGQLEAMRGL